MAWNEETGYLDVEAGWYDKDHSEDYWRGVLDTFVYLRDNEQADFLHTMLAHSAKSLLPEDYVEDTL